MGPQGRAVLPQEWIRGHKPPSVCRSRRKETRSARSRSPDDLIILPPSAPVHGAATTPASRRAKGEYHPASAPFKEAERGSGVEKKRKLDGTVSPSLRRRVGMGWEGRVSRRWLRWVR